MVVMSVLGDQLMQPVAQHSDAAINGEQQAGDELMGNSPHGGITPQRFESSDLFLDPSSRIVRWDNRNLPRSISYLRKAATDGPTVRPMASE